MEKEDPSFYSQQPEARQPMDTDQNEESKTEVANTSHIDDGASFYLEMMGNPSELTTDFRYNTDYDTTEMMKLQGKFFTYKMCMDALFFEDDGYNQ
jgi:hypothetical protein